jgi:hypothetical protein
MTHIPGSDRSQLVLLPETVDESGQLVEIEHVG